MQDPNKQALKQEIEAYRKLASLGLTNEFQEYSNRLVKTVTDKMIFAFTSDTVKTIEDYYKLKGEIVARLQPLQEVFEAGAMAQSLEERLKEYYTNTDGLTR